MHNGILLFLNLGTQEVVLIVFAALMLFGGEKLPELARGLGKGIREFKDATEGVKREIHRNINELTATEELKREEEIENEKQHRNIESEIKKPDDASNKESEILNNKNQ
ncbi:MAG: twin-arginine translocase TatA/TatE family subunit [Bacteroidetes bacterium]|nr:twin-arginine translocase TatA/TatE family subunit [Bacteroidota bacterium]MBU1371836.1 twin-arginine translocase TatA/TatE family subunit [Bacteroidota bacterium]MBU1483279.1 twin-arginine translocase TatA/TatE family subunit [Bacteroidota bacterium]MBU1761070.1 twin-arginine translocase TatA/TatE family subunit [Bacteroidota bacterium]MBU2047342.1 twin-arginine translocase TatA/TatE family subunit [Bacteroidota bacterium]